MEFLPVLGVMSIAGVLVRFMTRGPEPLTYGVSVYADDLCSIKYADEPLPYAYHDQPAFNFEPDVRKCKRIWMNSWNCTQFKNKDNEQDEKVHSSANFVTQNKQLHEQTLNTLKKLDIPHVCSVIGKFIDKDGDYVFYDLNVDNTQTIEQAHAEMQHWCVKRARESQSGRYEGLASYRIMVRSSWCDDEQLSVFKKDVLKLSS